MTKAELTPSHCMSRTHAPKVSSIRGQLRKEQTPIAQTGCWLRLGRRSVWFHPLRPPRSVHQVMRPEERIRDERRHDGAADHGSDQVGMLLLGNDPMS